MVMASVAPYRPPGQSLHVAAPGKLKRPAGHTDVVGLTDPAGHAYPAVQLPLQAEDVWPWLPLYVPGAQGPEHDALTAPGVAP